MSKEINIYVCLVYIGLPTLIMVAATSLIEWAKTLFGEPKNEMRGLEWGAFYEQYHSNSYSPTQLQKRVNELYAERL